VTLRSVSFIDLFLYSLSEHLDWKYDFEADEWDRFGNEAKEFIRKLLVIDPAERMTSAQGISFVVLFCFVFVCYCILNPQFPIANLL
jgi:hypothetical protein